MKNRILSSIIMMLISVPIIVIGGDIFHITMLLLSLLSLKEIMDAREKKRELPLLVKMVSYVNMTLLILVSYTNNFELTMDVKLIASLFITNILPILIYHEKKQYNVEDAFFLIGSIIFLGISLSLLSLVREKGLLTLIYLLVITVMTDTYAFIVGILIGRHKLIESISPKKTWEGTIAGSLFGVGIATTFYLTVVNPSANPLIVIFVSLFLSLLGQFGDLIFSAIKRYYNIKDFSNLIPGHGGILDRLDSIILVVLGFMFFINIL